MTAEKVVFSRVERVEELMLEDGVMHAGYQKTAVSRCTS